MKHFVANNKLANSGRRPANHPAPTITGGHDSGNRMWIEEEQMSDTRTADGRQVTTEEAAVLQSYPGAEEPFVWCGAKTKVFLQIGNAVPPLLAQRVLEALWAPAADVDALAQADVELAA